MLTDFGKYYLLNAKGIKVEYEPISVRDFVTVVIYYVTDLKTGKHLIVPMLSEDSSQEVESVIIKKVKKARKEK